MPQKITAVSFARVVEPRTYAKIALGDHILPSDHELQYINHLGDRTAKDALEAIGGSKLILCSGSALNVGKPKINEAESNDLEPDFSERTVRELVLFFEYLVIQCYTGDPDAQKYLLLANCFSAQALAFAMVLVDELAKAGVDLKTLRDVNELNKLHPPEQTWEDKKPPFPIVRTRDTQLGLLPTEVVLPDHWIFEGMQPDKGLLYVHNQGILLEVLDALQYIKPKILAKRNVAVFKNGGAPVKSLADIFSYQHTDGKPLMIAAQPHLDYGRSLQNVINVLARATSNPKFTSIFRPGTGGAHPDGSPRDIKELLAELAAKGEDRNGHRSIENCLDKAGLAGVGGAGAGSAADAAG